ncbi:hypothetical protein GmHk_09G025216 [Glycine max]|nr:hypothetical protein GmHk_09G025216 [Glycine max]
MPRGRGSSGGVNHAPRPTPIQSDNRGSLFRTGCGSVFNPRSIQHETIVNGSPATATAPMANSLGGDTCNAPTKAFQDPFRPVLMILASAMGDSWKKIEKAEVGRRFLEAIVLTDVFPVGVGKRAGPSRVRLVHIGS